MDEMAEECMSTQMRKMCKDSLGRSVMWRYLPLTACINHLEHCCMVIRNGCAMSVLIQSLRNWRAWLGDSVPKFHSTRAKLCTYFSKVSISGAVNLCSKLRNNDFGATGAHEAWHRHVLVNEEIFGFNPQKKVFAAIDHTHWDSQASSSCELLFAVKCRAGKYLGGPDPLPATYVQMR